MKRKENDYELSSHVKTEMAYIVEYFDESLEQEWDKFVLEKCMNGTFLQTRKFLNYHAKDKFRDCSVCVRKGQELVAVLPACEISMEGEKTFFGHKGSTYGGICLSDKVYSASAVDEILRKIHEFLGNEGFERIYLKMVPEIYQKENVDLLDYFLYKEGYTCYNELNYFMHLDRYQEDILSQYSSSKRRDYRYSLKNNLVFRKLKNEQEIALFYSVLTLNLLKLGLKAVHTLEDLYDLYYNRFNDLIDFYGVYLDEKMIAGSMVFIFDKKIFHTQYLASNEDYLKMYPMDFLISNLIREAVECNMSIFSFGICTENQGRYLNLGLSRFKEGFGTEFCINRSYEKRFNL